MMIDLILLHVLCVNLSISICLPSWWLCSWKHYFVIFCCPWCWQSSEVPSWMFILWISQMLAILDKPEAVVVHDILQDIARLYPQVKALTLSTVNKKQHWTNLQSYIAFIIRQIMQWKHLQNFVFGQSWKELNLFLWYKFGRRKKLDKQKTADCRLTNMDRIF